MRGHESSLDAALGRGRDILAERPPELSRGEVHALLGRVHARGPELLDLAKTRGSPLYVLDDESLRRRARAFTAAFAARIPRFSAFFAVKCNNHPWTARTLTEEGLGLDVSSGEELKLALEAGSPRIVFSGPAKRPDELALAAAHADRVTVLMDSFAELDRLEAAAREAAVTVRAGVRLTTDERGLWRKFGIPPGQLGAFAEAAGKKAHVRFAGLHFHTSWNLTPAAHAAFLARLGGTLAELSPAVRGRLEFLDIGGGYWPEHGEWLSPAGCAWGRLWSELAPRPPGGPLRFKLPAAPIEAFAETIGEALDRHLFPRAACEVYAEPGRWIAHEAMHFLLTIADAKDDDILIADGGTNLVGWERFEHDWFPVVNLSRPGFDEHPCLVLGALCTPHDVWGTSVFGGRPRVGDVVCIPCQGAYTWSLRQHFIKPVAEATVLTAPR